jgi:glycosyltransferase involved in cell wall biosynthesis
VRVVVDADDLEGRGGFADLFAQRGVYPRWMVSFFDFQERWLLKRADAVTAASRFLENMAIDLRKKEHGSGGVFYVPNGPSPLPSTSGKSSVDVKDELGLLGKRVVLLYTRFFEYRLEEVLDVLERVTAELDDVRLLVVGKGEYREEEEFLRLAAARGLKDFIVYVGWVKPADIRAYIEAGDVAVYPFMDTLLNRAKCPGKLVQLMSLGKAIVADRVGQISEYIEDGKSGLLAEPGDTEGFARHVISLLKDEEQRRKVGLEAKEKIFVSFNWMLLTESVENAYRSVMRKINL